MLVSWLKGRRGDWGRTVQVIRISQTKSSQEFTRVANTQDTDIVIEISGTVGDDQIYTVRQINQTGCEVGKENCMYITLHMPYLSASGRQRQADTAQC